MGEPRPIRRMLVANRGEIAVRVIRACEELGIETVAVASTVDAGAMHARLAGRVAVVGEAPAQESYLRGDRILDAAVEHGCDAVHPGYGFLSQNADFADAAARRGVTFVGPGGAAMRLMGDKPAARRAMEKGGVPVVPGFEGGGDESAEEFARAAERVGFPLLVKAAAGGGGRGMRIVRERGELAEALDAARREAQKAFGDGRLFLERYLEGARHVEIQVLADAHGRCIHLLERECSIQRRYQKLLEESPSPRLDDDLRRRMGDAAVRAALASGYVNAGTVEFLVAPDGSFYFLEMNTRLQVEHPVTELVTGLDLVALQIAVAEGRRLPLAQQDVAGRGHAIECRVNAEDPAAGFVPSSGRVLAAEFPEGPGVRVDRGIEAGDVVQPHYDSLLAKVLVHGATRKAAIARMERALGRVHVLGVRTNVEFLAAVLRHPTFRAGTATTSFVQDSMSAWQPAAGVPEDALIVMAVAEALEHGDGAPRRRRDGPWQREDGFRVGGGTA